MIRLIDGAGNPFWINPQSIDMIHYHPTFERVELIYHSGSSCCSNTMEGSVDDVMKSIDTEMLRITS